MTPEDFRALTPLIYTHINPYGNFDLNMNERIPIDIFARQGLKVIFGSITQNAKNNQHILPNTFQYRARMLPLPQFAEIDGFLSFKIQQNNKLNK